MKLIKELNAYNQEIIEAQKSYKDSVRNRHSWLNKNRVKINTIYPNRGQIYEIVKIKKALKYDWYAQDLNEDIYYFKPKTDTLSLKQDFPNGVTGNEGFSVFGTILDSNFEEVIGSRYEEYKNVQVYITNLKEVDLPNTNKSRGVITKVYVMIDKNTGYYKIGRSVNPKIRERTLQSEKPTIEMLFNFNARVRDEKDLHNMFKSKRIRGEWFDLSGSDVNKIKGYFNNQI